MSSICISIQSGIMHVVCRFFSLLVRISWKHHSLALGHRVWRALTIMFSASLAIAVVFCNAIGCSEPSPPSHPHLSVLPFVGRSAADQSSQTDWVQAWASRPQKYCNIGPGWCLFIPVYSWGLDEQYSHSWLFVTKRVYFLRVSICPFLFS